MLLFGLLALGGGVLAPVGSGGAYTITGSLAVGLFVVLVLVKNLVWKATQRPWFIRAITRITPARFHRVQDGEASAEWLRENTDRDDVVLSAYLSGTLIPALAGNRVVVGHLIETIDCDAKETDVREFFSLWTSQDRREQILDVYAARFAIQSRLERVYGTYSMESNPERFRPVWRRREIAIYEVLP